MSSPQAALQATAIQQQGKLLHLPAVGSQCAGLAELAVKEKQSHLDYLEALLVAELEERETRLVSRRLREARLPRVKHWTSSISRSRRKSPQPRSGNWPKADTSSGPNRFCSSGTAEREKLTG